MDSRRAATASDPPDPYSVSHPRRIRLSRGKGWRLPPDTVNVARPSRYGNPYVVHKSLPCLVDGRLHAVPDRMTAVVLFRARLDRLRISDPAYLQRMLDDLRGKNVACWCLAEHACHGDVWLEFANCPPADLGRAS